jgi:DNA-directed RNA polymerase subunit L
MKRINTKISQEKKRKRNQLIIGIALVFVMMLSVFGIVANSFGPSEEVADSIVNYNGLDFYLRNNYWYTSIGNFNFIFSNNPKDLNESYLRGNESIKLLNTYSNLPLYLYSEDSTLNSLLVQNIGQFVERVQFACYQEEDCPEDYPIKSCEENFILILREDSPSLIQNGSCVYISGSYEDLPKVLDEFILRSLGIKNDL